MTQQTAMTANATEATPAAIDEASEAAAPAGEGEPVAEERARRVATMLRDCLGLDPLGAEERRDLARMAVATTLLDSLPDDEVDAMMTGQILATHLFAMNCFKSVAHVQGDERIRMQYLSQAGRLIALHGRQVEKQEQRRESRRFLAEQAAERAAAARRQEEWRRKETEFQAALAAATEAEAERGA